MTPEVRICVAVMGLGRCGSSLVMQMLAAGGATVAGAGPDHELPELANFMLGRAPAPPMEFAQGTAVKFLDPARHDFPLDWRGINWFGIWCTRNPREQAASMAKVMQLAGARPDGGRRRLINAIRRDTALARQAMQDRCVAVLDLAFEDILRDPPAAAATLASFYREGTGLTLNEAAMALVPFPRSPSCFNGMLEPFLQTATDLGLVGQQSTPS